MPECVMDGCARPAPDAWVCHQCGAWTANSLTEAGRLWPELSTTVARQARHGTPGPRPRGHAPAAPIRPDSGRLRHYADQAVGHAGGLVVDLAASDVGDVVRNTASTWARVIAEETGADWPATVPELLQWLAGRMEWARHQQWAVECLEELGGLSRLIRRTVDAPTELVDAGQCWADTGAGPCQRWLTARPGAEVITCPDCRTPHDTAARREWMLQQAGDMLGTPVELARWLSLPVGTVYSWVSRGRLVGSGGLYRVKDAQKLADERERVTA